MSSIELQSIPIRAALYERLSTIAAREGKKVEEIADKLLTEILDRSSEVPAPPRPGMTFAEILAPAHQYSREMGYTEEEISDFIDAEIEAYRA